MFNNETESTVRLIRDGYLCHFFRAARCAGGPPIMVRVRVRSRGRVSMRWLASDHVHPLVSGPSCNYSKAR